MNVICNKMAASMRANVVLLSPSRLGQCLKCSGARKSFATAPQGDERIRELQDRVNWSLDTEVTNHRRHPGVRQVKAVQLPEDLTSNIKNVLEGQTVRNLIPEATSLTNYLQSRKRPVENSEVRAAARHFSNEVDLEDMEDEEVLTPLVNRETRMKMKQVMKSLRKKLYRWKPVEYNEVKTLAYMLARMTPNYAVLTRVFKEIKEQDPTFEPKSVLDFGSGVGTTVWAANSLWGSLVKEYYLVETSKAMHQMSERLLQVEAGQEKLHVANAYFRFFMPVSPRARYSMTVSAYSLLELPSFSDRINAVRSLWKVTDDYMVLIENGSYESYLALMEARDAILQDSRHTESFQSSLEDSPQDPSQLIQDRLRPEVVDNRGHVFAPCVHDLSCPRLHDKSGTPCNFEQTYHPLRQFVGSRSLDIRTERFCYLVLKKGQRDTDREGADWPRVVRPVLRRARHVICRMCRHDGSLGEAVISKGKHSKDLYRCARYTNWGDIFPATRRHDTMSDETDDEQVS